MVDARLPAEWLASIRIDDLSDRAFRILTGALMWCNDQGTDGSIPARYTKYLHPDGDDPNAFDELEHAGIWTKDADGYLIAGWSTELRQPTADEVARHKESARQRQKTYRERQRTMRSRAAPSPNRVTRDDTRDVVLDVTSHGSTDSAAATSVTRDVRRRRTSPYCAKHPSGTTRPCAACARASAAWEAQQNTLPGLDWDVQGAGPQGRQ